MWRTSEKREAASDSINFSYINEEILRLPEADFGERAGASSVTGSRGREPLQM